MQTIYPVPIIYITGGTDPQTLEKVTQTSPYGYLLKPFEEDILITSIHIALETFSRQQALQDHHLWVLSIINSLSDYIFVTDYNGNILFSNRAVQVTCSIPHNFSKHLSTILCLSDDEGHPFDMSTIGHVYKSHVPISFSDITAKFLPDHTPFTSYCRFSPCQTDSNDVQGVVIVIRRQ